MIIRCAECGERVFRGHECGLCGEWFCPSCFNRDLQLCIYCAEIHREFLGGKRFYLDGLDWQLGASTYEA